MDSDRDASREAMGRRLKMARERKGYLTATAAADALGIDRPTYLAHENGSRGFNASAAKYARFFGVDFRWLVTGHGSITPRSHPVLDIFEDLDEARQREALNYLEFLKNRQ